MFNCYLSKRYFTFERTGIAPVTWDGTNWANGSGTSNEPTIDDQFRKLIIDGAGASLSQDAGCTCLETTPGADLDVSGFNINIKNDISNQGTLDVSTSSLTFNGTTNQNIDFNGFSAADVTLDNSNQLTLNLDPNELLEVSNVLDITNGILNTNGALLMVSDASDTGQIDELTGSNDINGDVIIERFIPARRAFRLVSSSVTTSTTINANWQEGATGYLNNPNPGFGTHITGVEPDPAINATLAQDGNDGFDYSPSGNASLFTFDDASQSWNAVANTDTNTLTAGDAYRLMIRGDRSIDVTDNATTPTDTKLRSTGSVVRGPLSVNPALTASGEVAMVGNPFQAIVDMETVLNTSTNLQQNFVVWDPTLGGTPTPGSPGGRGAFVTVDVTTNSNNNASSQMNKFLQPYQAAFVIATGSSPSLSFEESDKSVNESQLDVFSTQTSPHYMHMRLFDQLSFTNNDTSDDGLSIYFSPSASNAVDSNDAPKFFNIDENLAREESGALMSIENRAMPQVDEILPLYTSQYRTTSYVLELEVGNFPNNEIYLFDNYTDTEVELNENAINTYSFTVDQSISESVASNRFDIRFESTTLSTDEFEKSGISVYPNPASDLVNINFSQNTDELEQIVLYDLNGRLVFASKLNSNDIEQQIDVSNLSSGIYVLEINTVKHQYNTKVIVE
ncbi:MAG: T9SS type A sorting domain-containing protein [Bacteroidetes bacterium]|nr:T9SS type A sorting domain-containing protein [Bacteroidota bacterium]